MGGRGGASGGGGSPSGRSSGSPDYKRPYEIEMENAKDFEAYFAVEPGATKEATGYQMYVHQDVTGRSLIADTRKDIDALKRDLREANAMGKSYGMTQQSIDGMKAAIREKISLQEKAVTAMEAARSEYEKYKRQAAAGNAKAKRRGGRWM